jgi:hypothetical protein
MFADWDEQIHQSLNNECLKIKYTNKPVTDDGFSRHA